MNMETQKNETNKDTKINVQLKNPSFTVLDRGYYSQIITILSDRDLNGASPAAENRTDPYPKEKRG